MTTEPKLLQLASDAAVQAGKGLLKLFRRGDLSVRRKFDYPGSIVTNADFSSERLILSSIKRSRIPATVVSEEAGRIKFGGYSPIVWAVDPLDGTVNFAKKNPCFAVSVGVLLRDIPMFGAIYVPVLDELFTASRGQGAYLNGKRMSVSTAKSLRNSSLIFEQWNPEPRIPDPLAVERRLYGYTRTVRSTGSVAVNMCSVASGRFDGILTVFKKSPIWEIAAGCLITQEADGCVTNSAGKPWEGFEGSIVAGGKIIHDGLMSAIRGK
jgi:myo-inositol-1(or 4)-monophosphatase